MADLQQLEDQIVSLSLLDAAALVKKLEERLGVSAAAAAPVAVAGGGGGMDPFGIRRGLRGPNPPMCTQMEADPGPPLKENVSKEEAETVRKKFEGVATVEVK